jgi:conjugal transfer pilus assembly protein TraK
MSRPIPHTLGLLAAATLAAAMASSVLAAQTIDVRDADTTIVRISQRDQTRIRVLDGHITDAFGDLYDPAANPGGRLSITKDEADGELYVRPLPPPAAVPGIPPAMSAAMPVKLDLKTDRGSVALLLQPVEIIGETLTLNITGAAPKSTAESAAGFAERAGSHERVLKALTLAMANPAMSQAVPGRDLPGGPREVALWKEARFVLRRTHAAAGLVGEVYELTNISAQRMVIDERELYRPAVLSVAARRLVLEPGESTAVWIVRDASR